MAVDPAHSEDCSAMGLALLLNEGDLALLAHRPWLKAGEYTVLLE